MMRDLVIFIPSIEAGGVEKNLFYIAKFIKPKFKNIFLVSANKLNKNILGKKIKLLSPSSSFFKNKNRFLKSIICSYLIFKNFNNKNALIFSFQSNFFSIFMSKIINSKIIIRLNTSPEKYSSNLFKKLFFRLLYSFADEIIVNSNEFRKNLLKYFNLNSKVVFNPIKIKKRKKKVSFFHNFNGLKIISIGRLTHQKDHITLFEALNMYKNIYNSNFKLYLIGSGYNLKLLSDFIHDNKLQKNIRLAGYKSNASDYIKSSDLFILPSKYEGLPNTLIEAQVAGVPIIASKCPSGPKEILMNGKLGELFNVGDHKDLCKKIYNFYRYKQFLIKKSCIAKKHLYRFDYQNNLNKYFKILKKHIDK